MRLNTQIRDVDATVDLFDRASRALRDSRWRRHCVERLPARGRLLATGDIHDNELHLAKVMEIAALDKSRDNHVILHELIHGDHLVNGLDYSYRMLAKVAELVLAYPGQVHPLLANHEMAQMTGRSVGKGATQRVELFNQAIEFVYGDGAARVIEAVGRFIGAMPIAVTSESGLFCSHSLPADSVMRRFDLNLPDRDLRTWDYIGPGGSAYELTWGREYSEKTVQLLAARWNVRLFVVGHNHVRNGVALRAGMVVVLNTDHDQAKVLPLDLADIPRPIEAVGQVIDLAEVRTNGIALSSTRRAGRHRGRGGRAHDGAQPSANGTVTPTTVNAAPPVIETAARRSGDRSGLFARLRDRAFGRRA